MSSPWTPAGFSADEITLALLLCLTVTHLYHLSSKLDALSWALSKQDGIRSFCPLALF